MASVKTAPHNADAEESVLGSILIDKNAISTVSGILQPSDFYNDIFGMLYGAMLALFEERKPIDVVTLTAYCKKNPALTKVSASTISDLVNTVATAANVEHYANIIKEASTKRALISAGTQIAELGYKDEEVKEILDKAESSIFAIARGQIKRDFIPIKDALAESFERIDELHKKGGELRGVRTGFTELDNLLSGMQESNLLVLAARPGQGKTAFAVNVAAHIGVKEKEAIGIFSLEMSQEELVDRLLVGQADIDAWKVKTRRLSDNDFEKISDAMGQLGEAKIFIDDTPGITINEIRTKARRLQLEHGLKVLIVDYLQLVDPGRRYDNRVQEVSIVSQSLKNLARELKIPVVAVSQLSRAVEHRGERKPQLADLRESGAIEQDADVVMFLYREVEEFMPTMPVKLLIAKHRNGPTGELDLLFRGDRIRFYNVEKQHREGAPAA